MTVRVCGHGHRYTGARCQLCEYARDQRRGTAAQRGYDADYQRERRELIGQPCELRLPGCTGVADTADHVVARQPGQRVRVDRRIRPACSHCNFSRGKRDVVTGVGV